MPGPIRRDCPLRIHEQIVYASFTHKPEEYLPGPDFRSDEELAFAAGNVGTTIFHPVGTCKMGLEGFRVVDAWIMPTITSGNTSAPTVMIATMGAAMIRADRVGGRLMRMPADVRPARS